MLPPRMRSPSRWLAWCPRWLPQRSWNRYRTHWAISSCGMQETEDRSWLGRWQSIAALAWVLFRRS